LRGFKVPDEPGEVTTKMNRVEPNPAFGFSFVFANPLIVAWTAI